MIKVNSRKEILDFGGIVYDEPQFIRNGLGAFHLKDDTYPKYFKYSPPMEVYCCGTYDEVTQEEYKQYLENKILEIKKELEKLETALEGENGL